MKAKHKRNGNYFDNIIIDINESHYEIDKYKPNKETYKSSFLFSKISFFITALLMKTKLQNFLVINGIKKEWFNDFNSYWINVINGRPLQVLDFFLLLHDYRKRQQYTESLSWTDSNQHVINWQNPNQIYAIFHNIRKLAISPIVGYKLWNLVKKNSNILEYGCSCAPYYNCYNKFFSYLNCNWILADIPNFPFHYSKFHYGKYTNCKLHTINPNIFHDPLGKKDCYDVIILTTVLEHLDDPVFVSNYLLDRLNTNGLLVFDYVLSEGTGLDTPNALLKREECLKLIMNRTSIIHGFINTEKDTGLCIVRKL